MGRAWQVEWIRAWYVVCRRCGATTVECFGWSENEAIEQAISLGWRDGLCEDCFRKECLAVERVRLAGRLRDEGWWETFSQEDW
jgi:hypothetical protein